MVHAAIQPVIIAAFLLGLVGSLGHCVTMCGAVTVLMSRAGATSGWRLPLLHFGRLITYTILGGLAGALGTVIATILPGIQMVQGGFAVLVAFVGVYFALAFLGKLPSPEIVLSGLTRRWGTAMRQATNSTDDSLGVFRTIGMGLLWGMLPCGLVLAALLTATTVGSLPAGMLVMAAFGLGTIPALIAVALAARSKQIKMTAWPRTIAASFILLFSVQMALRGLAAWGWVNHLVLGEVLLW